MAITIESENIRYGKNEIESSYLYNSVRVERDGNTIKAIPKSSLIRFKTDTRLPKTGCMLVGWGGNNGSTVTAAILANKMKLEWETKEGIVKSNYFGSLTQSSTVYIGIDGSGRDVYMPMKDLIPMINPNDLILDGWDISSLNLYESMKRAKVIDVNLQKQLVNEMSCMKPRKAIFDVDFVAANQQARADNVIDTKEKSKQIDIIRQDIRDFKAKNQLDKVIVLWTANTERYAKVEHGLNGTKENLLKSIERNESEISPSTLYAVASILEGAAYINGSPQNTFVPGVIELAVDHGVFIGGDDFKSGQTKFKSVLVDFLVSAGIKPCSIVSYNHLGNNDGYNLSAPMQFKSKEISKSNVVDDMVESNDILFGGGDDNGGLKKPDHCVVIKYVPYVGDSKRAMDEFTSELMLGGRNTIVVHNTCEDSLLASPIILDLVILTELFQRVTFKVEHQHQQQQQSTNCEFKSFNSVLSILSYLLKAPLVEKNATVVNALFKQRACIENVLRALVSLPPVDQMYLHNKVQDQVDWYEKNVDKLIN